MSQKNALASSLKCSRFTDYKRMTPFEGDVKVLRRTKLITVKRGVRLFLSNVEVFGENNIGGQIQTKSFSPLAASLMCSMLMNACSAPLKENGPGWDFRFMQQPMGNLPTFQKMPALVKNSSHQLITTSCKSRQSSADHPLRTTDHVVAVMSIDLVLKGICADMLNWSQLFRHNVSIRNPDQQKSSRSSFEQDFDRIIFRSEGCKIKRQVHPLPSMTSCIHVWRTV